MRNSIWLIFVLAWFIVFPTVTRAEFATIGNGDFERGLSAPWGTGQNFDQADIFWRSGECHASARVDEVIRHRGASSLYIINASPRAPDVYGTTQQPFQAVRGVRYRVSVWARANNLASAGAVSLIVDPEWKIRPIQLPAGTYDWTEFTGEFSLPNGDGQIRILSEDRGEVWLDDITVAPLADQPVTKAPEDVVRVERLARAVAEFRTLGRSDYQKALAKYASDEVREKFKTLDTKVWANMKSQFGWSYFFDTSLFTAADPRAKLALAAYYNPWGDVFLVTVWEHRADDVRLIDAELVMGDLLRSRGLSVTSPVPLWLREKTYRPAALGNAAAESIDAFERLFAKVAAGDWRREIRGLDDRNVLVEVNYSGAAIQMLDAFKRLDQYHVPAEGEHASLENVREQTAAAMKRLAEGQCEAVVAEASQTLPAVRDVLRKMDAKTFEQWFVISTVLGDDASLVCMTQAADADACLMLLFTGRPGHQKLTRIDLISFNAFYNIRHAKGNK